MRSKERERYSERKRDFQRDVGVPWVGQLAGQQQYGRCAEQPALGPDPGGDPTIRERPPLYLSGYRFFSIDQFY